MAWQDSSTSWKPRPFTGAAVLAELVEAPTYFVHISCEEALARWLAAKGRRACRFTPRPARHYLTLDDSVYDGDTFDVAST